MRICVLQSSYEGSNHPTEIFDDMPDPSLFTAQHEFHHRYLKKATAEAEIDAAIAEGYDLFFNFMWGQAEDVVAGIDAVRYLESREVLFVGFNSTTLERSKLEFYAIARAAGLPVPASGADMKFPVFVKPAKMCASMLVDEHAVCHNQEELNVQLQRINELLAPRRELAMKANTVKKPLSDGAPKVVNHAAQIGSNTPSVNDSLHDHDDIVVQEYIPGRDYSVVVIEMGNTPVALNPTLHQFPPGTKIDFQTFDIKFHPKLSEVLLLREDNPDLFDRLRELAERAWRVNEMQGSSWGNVDIRERTDGKLFILEVNYMPTIFYRRENEWEDIVIRESFPGGHRALVNSVITTTLLQAGKHKAAVKLVAFYDDFSSTYDTKTSKFPVFDVVDFLVKSYDFSGTVLDLGCGTGAVGRKLYIHQKEHNLSPSRVVGIDISQGMVDQNPIPASYAEYRIAPVQELIMNLTEQFDHIVSHSTFLFLDEITLSAVLARMFQVARKSITFTVDEVPEAFSEAIQQHVDVRVWNNLAHVEGFGVPRGWRVAYRNRRFGWKSPHTGVDVYVTSFRFEALKPCKHRNAA